MAAKRKIIAIAEDRCTGCGLCIPNCPEGALQVIDGKARLVSDLFCDGLGACVGHCPEGAMTVEEREAEPYDEAKVMENIVKAGPNTIAAHLEHLKEHGAKEYYDQAVAYLKERGISAPLREPDQRNDMAPPVTPSVTRSRRSAGRGDSSVAALPRNDMVPPDRLACGCPGSAVRDLGIAAADRPEPTSNSRDRVGVSHLRNWPVQITLVPPSAPYLKEADILIAADCVAAAHPGFHKELVRGRVLLIGCPKLDDAQFYTDKLTELFRTNRPKSVLVAHMTVPCCFGLVQLVRQAIKDSGCIIPFADVTIDVDGKAVKQIGTKE